MRYNDGTTDRLGVLIDFPNGFGAADLWWCRFLITGKEEDRLRALVALRDRLFWGNAPGPLVLVTTGNRSGFPYNGGNVGRARTFAWAMECGGLLPWDGSAEASSFTALR
jgi:hypothetical protein